MSLLRVIGVSKRFGALQALAGVDLTLEPGQFHGLIGPNGSGKSTLMKTIAGEHAPSGGQVLFDNSDITSATADERARRGLSIKFQITSVLPALTVYDNVLLALQAFEPIKNLVYSRSRAALHNQVMAALADFRLSARAFDPAAILSHGEQQWLEIAMTLAQQPKAMLLDEPTAGMSLEERRATGELLQPLRGRCALIIVEHDLDFIRDLCDVLTVLDQGQVLASGTVDEVQRDPKVQQVYTTRA